MNSDPRCALIGGRLRTARLLMRMSQHAAADSLGVSQQAIANWESGESIPRVPVLLDACMVYGVSPNYILLAEPLPTRYERCPEDGRLRCALERTKAPTLSAGTPQ